MRTLAMITVAAAALAAGCASTERMRDVQESRAAPTSRVLFPLESELRDAVVLDWIGGVSQHSYIFAEPNQTVLKRLVQNALRNSGLEAGTPVRARYGLRVLVSDADGPNIGADAHAHLTATYTLVERATGREIFKQSVKTDGTAVYLGLNEHDFKLAWDISAPALTDVLVVGGVAHLVEHSNINLNSVDGGDWDRFWNNWRALPLRTMVAGPALAGALFVNPFNYLPWADDDDARKEAEQRDDVNDFRGAEPHRNGARRAAQAVYRASMENVSGFLLALAKDQGVTPKPLFPCHGSPKIEALKRAALSQGVGFTTDDCTVPRSRFFDEE